MLLGRVTSCSRYFKCAIWWLSPGIVRQYSAAWTTHPFISPSPLYQCGGRRFERALYRISKTRSFSSVPTTENSDTEKKLLLQDSYVRRYHQVVTDASGFIRLSVEGGGCSGFQYEFNFDTKLGEDDVWLEQDGAKLVIDRVSLDLLDGASVEFHEELIRSSFRVVDIPNVESGCSCGASFSLKV